MHSLAQHNIPPELLPLWHREKHRFDGSPDQMAEQFMLFVHENPGDVLEAQEAAGLTESRRLERELAKEQRRHFEREAEPAEEFGDAAEPEEGDTAFDPAEFEEPTPARRSGPKLSAKARTVGMFSSKDLYSSFKLVSPQAQGGKEAKPIAFVDTYSVPMFEERESV